MIAHSETGVHAGRSYFRPAPFLYGQTLGCCPPSVQRIFFCSCALARLDIHKVCLRLARLHLQKNLLLTNWRPPSSSLPWFFLYYCPHYSSLPWFFLYCCPHGSCLSGFVDMKTVSFVGCPEFSFIPLKELICRRGFLAQVEQNGKQYFRIASILR